MARGLTPIEISFPAGLMDTAESANLNPQKKARRILNMLPDDNTAGSGVPRFGFYDLWDALPGPALDVFEFRKSDGTLEVLVAVDETTKHTVRRINADGSSSIVIDNLSSTGLIRAVHFNGVLCFCNGIDNNRYYDGSTVTEMEEEVEEGGGSETSIIDYVSSDEFSVSAGEDLTGRYSVGAYVRVVWDGGELESTVATSSYDSGTGLTTVQVNSGTITASAEPYQAFYKDKPPAFSYFSVQNNYLLALSGGETKARDFRGTNGLTVYSTDRPNNQNAWFNATTQDVPFLNCQGRHGMADEFIAITELAGYTVFMGRKGMQLWQITDFVTAGGALFSKFISVGLVNPNLLQPFPSDVLFVTPYGARSLGNVFQTEGLEVKTDLGTAIDGDITSEVRTMISSDAAFKKARSFFYEEGGFYGFRFNSLTYVYVLSEKSKGWVVFDGYFEDFQACRGLSDGTLVLFKGEQGAVYANGMKESYRTLAYTDGGAGFECLWWTKWFRFKNRWANRHFTLVLESSAAMDITLERFLDNDDDQGKAITFSVDASSPAWDESFWDEELWSIGDKIPRYRDKFLCDSMALLIKFNTSQGSATILGIKAEGS